jgi:hypothetical protein
MPKARDAMRTFTGSKVADSKRIRRVEAVVLDSSQPITPAIAKIFTSSAMTRVPSGTATGSAVNSGQARSPARERRIVTAPTKVSASKTWVGWPSSKLERFVASTGASTDARPAARKGASCASVELPGGLTDPLQERRGVHEAEIRL